MKDRLYCLKSREQNSDNKVKSHIIMEGIWEHPLCPGYLPTHWVQNVVQNVVQSEGHLLGMPLVVRICLSHFIRAKLPMEPRQCATVFFSLWRHVLFLYVLHSGLHHCITTIFKTVQNQPCFKELWWLDPWHACTRRVPCPPGTHTGRLKILVQLVSWDDAQGGIFRHTQRPGKTEVFLEPVTRVSIACCYENKNPWREFPLYVLVMRIRTHEDSSHGMLLSWG